MEEQQPILAAPHFYWGSCLICSKTPTPDLPLKRCSRCHSVYYCSSQHQKKHWKKHKDMCTYLANAANTAEQDTFFCGAAGMDKKEWNVFRSNAAKTASVILSRPLDLQEQEMLLFPRCCRMKSCHIINNQMQDCTKCYAVSYCGSQHREEGAQQHIKFCRQLVLCRLLDHHESTVGVGLPAIPAHLDKTYLGSAPDISHFIEQPWAPDSSNIIQQEVQWSFLTSQLSGPLTLLDTGHRFVDSFSTKEDLTIHIVGAGIVEMIGVIKWEYLAHRLPALRNLKFVFIGPELEDESEEEPTVPVCGDCEELGRTIDYRVHCGTYQEYKQSDPDFNVPDIVFVQNCGFSEFKASSDCPEWINGWAQLNSLLQGNTPLVFTSYTLGEAEKDFNRVLETVEGDVEVLTRCENNSMRSHRPFRDWEQDNDCDVFYSNQYLSVVKRKESHGNS